MCLTIFYYTQNLPSCIPSIQDFNAFMLPNTTFKYWNVIQYSAILLTFYKNWAFKGKKQIDCESSQNNQSHVKIYLITYGDYTLELEVSCSYALFLTFVNEFFQ